MNQIPSSSSPPSPRKPASENSTPGLDGDPRFFWFPATKPLLQSRLEIHPVFPTALVLLAGLFAFGALPGWHETVSAWWGSDKIPFYPFDIDGFVGWSNIWKDNERTNLYGVTLEALEGFLQLRSGAAGLAACLFSVLFARFERRPSSPFPLRVLRNLLCILLTVNLAILALSRWPFGGCYDDLFSIVRLPSAGEPVSEESKAVLEIASRISNFLVGLTAGLLLGILALFARRFVSPPDSPA